MGALAFGDKVVDTINFKNALNMLSHRGPDDFGYLSYPRNGNEPQLSLLNDSKIVLGHRRLSIIDRTSFGRQPMRMSGAALAFNGEIYNFIELRKEYLPDLSFVSDSDTEVALKLLSKFGSDALPLFSGMFAVAFLNEDLNILTLARDPLGIKPLFYHQTKDRISFGSELPPLLKLTADSRKASARVVKDFLEYGITEHTSNSFFMNFHAVEPGTLMTFSLNNGDLIDHRKFRSIGRKQRQFGSIKVASEFLRERFDYSLSLHLRSDVPIAFSLSGGLDSSAIVASAKRSATSELTCFSFIPKQKTISEKPWVDRIAQHLKIHSIQITPEIAPLSKTGDLLITQQGEPFGSLSIAAQALVYEAIANAGFKVAIGGQGADEIFGGYKFFIFGRMASLLRSGEVQKALKLYFNHVGLNPAAMAVGIMWLRRFGLAPPIEPISSYFHDKISTQRINAEFLRSEKKYRPYSELKDLSLYEILRESINYFLPHLLRYEDRNAMSFSIENRVPFVWPTLIEEVISLPEEWLISDCGQSKMILREMFREDLPKSLIERKDKVPYLSPQAAWLQESKSWVKEVIQNSDPSWVRLFQPRFIRRLYNGQANHDRFAWRTINVLRWAQIFDVEAPEF